MSEVGLLSWKPSEMKLLAAQKKFLICIDLVNFHGFVVKYGKLPSPTRSSDLKLDLGFSISVLIFSESKVQGAAQIQSDQVPFK